MRLWFTLVIIFNDLTNSIYLKLQYVLIAKHVKYDRRISFFFHLNE